MKYSDVCQVKILSVWMEIDNDGNKKKSAPTNSIHATGGLSAHVWITWIICPNMNVHGMFTIHTESTPYKVAQEFFYVLGLFGYLEHNTSYPGILWILIIKI